MITVRAGTVNDWPEVLRMGKAFFKATAFGSIGFDELSAQLTFEHLLNAKDDAILLIVENGAVCGMAAALLYPFYFNMKHRTAQELFWWVDENARGTGAGIKLLHSLEQAAKQRGAQSLSMIALDKIEGPQVDRLYQHFDYSKSEQAYLKVL